MEGTPADAGHPGLASKDKGKGKQPLHAPAGLLSDGEIEESRPAKRPSSGASHVFATSHWLLRLLAQMQHTHLI
jgi:hypothetical protein